MATLHVLQTGCTTCQQQNRFEVVAGAPLTAQGLEQVQSAVAGLAATKFDAVYCGTSQAQRHTAAAAGNALRLRPREHEGLCELDFGLWQGLTLDELERRQPRLYKQWLSNPASIQPPEGETLEQAQARLLNAIDDISSRNRNKRILLVLGPIMSAILRCIAADRSADDLWRMMIDGAACFQIELDARNLLEAEEQV